MIFSRHCQVCHKELETRAVVRWAGGAPPQTGALYFHKEGKTPICKDALARDQK